MAKVKLIHDGKLVYGDDGDITESDITLTTEGEFLAGRYRTVDGVDLGVKCKADNPHAKALIVRSFQIEMAARGLRKLAESAVTSASNSGEKSGQYTEPNPRQG